MDLPVWQALYQELGEKGWTPITVAFDNRGREAARPWIEGARVTYPCLIDEHHLVAELYGMVNVPQAVWIDEEGRIVRPTETAGTTDAFREMDHTNYTIPEDARQSLARVRRAYQDALRDWAQHGAASRFALSSDEVQRRLKTPTADHALATAHFRMGDYLHSRGFAEAAQRHFDDAKRLRPDSWAYKRQAWNLEDPNKSGGPEFWAAVDALGDDYYYEPLDLG
jgi:hypothetical protein